MRELYAAVRSGDPAAVQKIVDAEPGLALFAAAMQGDVAALENLLSANRSSVNQALISSLSSDGWTPLHLAALFGRADAVRLLINKGADVAARSGNAMANTALHAAAAGRASGVAKILIECGASPNTRQNGGWTPLHAAAQNGDVELARTLLDSGADVTIRADNQQSPLDLALTKGQQAMVEFLEERGARL
jgi:ankyrin repeat protein